MRTLILLTTLASAAALSTPAASPAGNAASETASADRSTLTVSKSRFGRILFDGRGFVLYAFTRDSSARSACYGACATAWPPYLVPSKPRAGTGITASLLGTTRRRDGKLQATYAGRPLYYYIGDTRPGQILCQNVEEFGGLWLVVRPTGKPVR